MTCFPPTRFLSSARNSQFIFPFLNAALPMIIFSAPHERIRVARATVRIPPPTRTFIFARAHNNLIHPRVGTFTHGGIQIDDVKNWIAAETIEQAKHIVDGESALASVN